MRTFAALTAGGIGSIILLKLLSMLMAPLLGFLMAFFGIMLTVLKFALIAAAAYFLYSLFFKRRRERENGAA